MRYSPDRFLGAFSLVLLFVFLGTTPGQTLEITAGTVFNQMEERTDAIETLQSDLIMSSGPVSTRVHMVIQSPDKFTMNFLDRSIRVIFDGEKLWIYLQDLKEVFTMDTSTRDGWLSDSLRTWVNPKKIITQITRSTLFTFFDVRLIPDSTEPGVIRSVSGYRMRFTPLGSSFFKRVFGVGYYDLVFSKESFLPVMVTEYEPNGNLRGILTVLEYRLNQEIPPDTFDFTVPPDVKEVPLIEVIKQKVEQETEGLFERLGGYMNETFQNVNFWGN
jgi:outer membrane lipoprotein-sorting protein